MASFRFVVLAILFHAVAASPLVIFGATPGRLTARQDTVVVSSATTIASTSIPIPTVPVNKDATFLPDSGRFGGVSGECADAVAGLCT